MSGNEVVLDIETQNTFQDVGANEHRLLRISVVGCYFYETNEYCCFEESELPQLFQRLERAGRIIGYNTKGFDYLVMARYYAGDLSRFPSLDIMEEIVKALGFRVKLNDVARATLGLAKSGHGLQAVQWWQEGQLDKIKDYCLMDVKITKEIYEFGKKYRLVRFFDRLGGAKDVPVQFEAASAVSPALNLTLGV